MIDVIAGILLLVTAPLFILGAVVGTGRYSDSEEEE